MINQIVEQFLIAACIATIEASDRLTEEFNNAMKNSIASNGWGMFSPPDMGKMHAMAALDYNEKRWVPMLSLIEC